MTLVALQTVILRSNEREKSNPCSDDLPRTNTRHTNTHTLCFLSHSLSQAPPAERSLLANAIGYVTLKATMKAEVPSADFVWGALRKVLPEGCTEGAMNVRGMQLTSDGHGAPASLQPHAVPGCSPM